MFPDNYARPVPAKTRQSPVDVPLHPDRNKNKKCTDFFFDLGGTPYEKG